MPELGTMIVVALVLFVALLVPFLFYEIRRGKSSGRTPTTRERPVGHSDLGDDTGRGPGGTTRITKGSSPEGAVHEDAGSPSSGRLP